MVFSFARVRVRASSTSSRRKNPGLQGLGECPRLFEDEGELGVIGVREHVEEPRLDSLVRGHEREILHEGLRVARGVDDSSDAGFFDPSGEFFANAAPGWIDDEHIGVGLRGLCFRPFGGIRRHEHGF